MNSFFSGWFSKKIKDPKIVELLPGEHRTSISLPDGSFATPKWASEKLSRIKSHWMEINPSIIDAIYESSLEYEKDPTLRYNFPDRDRFKELIWINCLRIFQDKDNLEVSQDLPDYEVDFWSPRCGSFGGILRIQIKNWLPQGVTIFPEDNPYPSKR